MRENRWSTRLKTRAHELWMLHLLHDIEASVHQTRLRMCHIISPILRWCNNIWLKEKNHVDPNKHLKRSCQWIKITMSTGGDDSPTLSSSEMTTEPQLPVGENEDDEVVIQKIWDSRLSEKLKLFICNNLISGISHILWGINVPTILSFD